MFSALKQTGKDAAIYGVGQGVVKVAAFLLVPLYTRYLPQQDFGKLGLLTVVNSVAITLLSMGLTSAIFRSYYDYDDDENRKMVINTTLFLMAAIALVILPLGVWFIPSLSKVLFGDTSSNILIWLILIKAAALSFRGVPLAIYRARRQSIKFVIINLVAVVFKLVVIIYLVVVSRQGLIGVILGDTVTAVIMTLVTLWTIRLDLAPVFSWLEARKLLAFGLPLVPADLASMVFTRADLFFLNKYTDLSVVGQYNAAVMAITAIQELVKTPFMLIWTPMLLSVEKEKYAKIFYARVAIYLFTIMGFLTLGISLFANEIIWIVAGPGYELAAQVLPILCLAQVFYIVQISLSVGITLKRKTQYIPLILGVVALVTLVSNFVLVPAFGILGAGVAGLISAIVFVVLIYWISNRIYYIQYDVIRVAKVVSVLLAVYIITLMLKTSVSGWLYLGVRFTMLLLALFLLFTWHFWEKDEIEVVRRQLARLNKQAGFLVRGSNKLSQ